MRRRGRIAGAVVVIAIACGISAMPAAAPASPAPNLNWTALLPAMPSPLEPQPGPVPFCPEGRVSCIRTEIRRLTALRDRLGCDHRAVFATTYLELTKEFLRTVEAEPGFFRYPSYLYTEDALFAEVYFNTVDAWERGEPVAGAWRIAFQSAATGDLNAAQDMLLGINAHVQNDMPFVLASLGLRAPDGASRKGDHDAVNEVFNRAYQPVVDAVARRYDPNVRLTNSPLTPLDDVAGLEMVRGWRELVWRNAERLLNARTGAEREAVANQIEANAAAWATSISGAGLGLPGYRAQRDAYCNARDG
ncbi:MAG: DUF5995 family protein [Solirubrobacterales bacterium]